MKTMKLIDKIQKLLTRPDDDVQVKKLRKMIKVIKQRQEDLEERFKRTRSKGSRRRLRRKIEKLRVARIKGAETYRRLIALRENDVVTAPPSRGSVVFLADQAAAAQYRVNQRRLHEQAEDHDAKGDRLDGPPVGQFHR